MECKNWAIRKNTKPKGANKTLEKLKTNACVPTSQFPVSPSIMDEAIDCKELVSLRTAQIEEAAYLKAMWRRSMAKAMWTLFQTWFIPFPHNSVPIFLIEELLGNSDSLKNDGVWAREIDPMHFDRQPYHERPTSEVLIQVTVNVLMIEQRGAASSLVISQTPILLAIVNDLAEVVHSFSFRFFWFLHTRAFEFRSINATKIGTSLPTE